MRKETNLRLTMAALALGTGLVGCSKSPEIKPTPTPELVPTVPRPTDIPPSPTIVIEKPTPTPTPTGTPTPTPTETLIPLTPTPICGELTLKDPKEKVYIRTGPGTNYQILETLDPNEKFLVHQKTTDGKWMLGDLVDSKGNVTRKNVWVTGGEKWVNITCGKEGIPPVSPEQIPPTPTPKPTETPKPPELSPLLRIEQDYAGNGYYLVIDTSTPLKKAVYDLFVRTLQEMGYTLRIHGRDRMTDELSLPGDAAPGSHQSGCARFGWRWDTNAKVIDVFFFVDRPWSLCNPWQFTATVADAIVVAKGIDYSWWYNGLASIESQLGRPLTEKDGEDMPIGVNFKNEK